MATSTAIYGDLLEAWKGCIGKLERLIRFRTFSSDEVSVPLVVLLYLALPNLLLLLAAHMLGALPRGLINLEFLLIGAVGLFLPRRLVFAALWLESLFDFTYSICYTYRFSPGDLIASTHYLTLLPLSRVLQGMAVLGLSAGVCAVLAGVAPRPKCRMWTACALLGCAAIPVTVDAMDGQNMLWRKDSTVISVRLVRSPAFVLGAWEISAIRLSSKGNGAADSRMESASAQAIAFLDKRPTAGLAPNLVVVVVESWGLALDVRFAEALTAPYGESLVTEKYDVASGKVHFAGPTVPGEARELCQSATGFGILQPTPQLAAHCLPAIMRAKGYETIAIHGFVGQMFYRSAWYPKLGFEHSWFGPELHQAGLANCPGAFPGVCDGAIGAWLGGVLGRDSGDKPKFIYWVTLNSHLPEPSHPQLPDDNACAAEPALKSSEALCSWFRLVRAVHQSVEETAVKQGGRPTVFLLVGDHAPPFSDPRLRAQFSTTEVPYILLTPKIARSDLRSISSLKGGAIPEPGT